MKAQSSKDRKVRQEQFQNFHHKERSFSNMKVSKPKLSSLKIMKGRQLYRACFVKHSDQKDDLVICEDFFDEANKICFLDNMSQLLVPLSAEPKLGKNLKIKIQ